MSRDRIGRDGRGDGSQRRGAAVLGSPVGHSLSPVLHRAAYDLLGLDGWGYRTVECDEAALPGVLRELDEEGLAGVSLTMPLKKAVLPLLGAVDGPTREVGAANTVLFGDRPGEWAGANTDVPGFVAALQRPVPPALAAQPHTDAGGVWPEGQGPPDAAPAALGSVAVLGGGATATSALAAVRRTGVAAVQVFLRRPGAAGDLVAAAGRIGVEVGLRPFDEAASALREFDLVVATTPAGSTDALAGGLSGGVEPEGSPGSGGSGALGVLFDVVYAPWPTRLAAAWAAAGGGVIGGLELLVEQAALQVELMTGRRAPVEAMRVAGRAALRRP